MREVAAHWSRISVWMRSINGRLALWLALITGVLFLVTGAIREWRLGSGRGSEFVAALWHLTWSVYTLIAVWLICVVVGLAYRRVGEAQTEQR